jgi:hypothetical protein
MIIDSANQPKKENPQFDDPVNATLDCHVYVATDDGVMEGNRKIYCDRVFAVTVLKPLEAWCLKYGFGIIHIGVYYPRPARNFSGQEIKPRRWSNHAYGLAIDFKGVRDNNGKNIYMDKLLSESPAKMKELLININNAIKEKGRKPELVNERSCWYHLGVWRK